MKQLFIYLSIALAYPLISLIILIYSIVKQKKIKQYQKYIRVSSFVTAVLLYILWINWAREPIMGLFLQHFIFLQNLIQQDKSLLFLFITYLGILFLASIHFLGAVIPNYLATRKIGQFSPPFLRFALVGSFFQIGIFSLNAVFETVGYVIPKLLDWGGFSPAYATPIFLLLIPLIYLLFQQYLPALLSHFFGYTSLFNAELIRMINNLSRRCGVKLKSLRILKGNSLRIANGWAYGILTHHVCLTDNLIQRLSLEEVEAVLAHELGHVKQRHILLQFLFIMSAMLVSSVIATFAHFIFDYLKIPFPNFLFETLSTLIVILILLKISRSNEFRADQFSADATGNPEALISALKKLTYTKKRQPLEKLTEIFKTHPSIKKRVQNLEKRGSNHPFYANHTDNSLLKY